MPLIKLNATQGLTGTLPAVSGVNLTNIDGGKVLQVVTDTYTDQNSTSGTFATFKTMSITKSASSNKVIIQLSGLWITDSSGSGWAGGSVRVQRNADSGGATNFATTDFLGGESIPNYVQGSLGNTFVDSGSGTSISYTFAIAKGTDATSFNLGGSHYAGDGESNYITLTEIEA